MNSTKLCRLAWVWACMIFVQLIYASPTSVRIDTKRSTIEPRNAQLGDLLGGLGSLLGGTLGGLGSTVGDALGGVGSALGNTLGGLLGSGGNSTPAKPVPSTPPKQPPPPKPSPPPVVVVSPPPKPTGDRRGSGDFDDDDSDKGSRGGRGENRGSAGSGSRDNESQRKVSHLSVSTKGDEVPCRTYADTIISDPSSLQKYRSGTKIEVTCFTKSEMKGVSGNVRGDSTWLKTNKGCFVNEMEIQGKDDFQAILNYCASPKHWVGTLKSQYTRVDCYDCTSLDCPSRNVGVPPYVDLACAVKGEVVLGNSTWLKSQAQSCYVPGSAFNPYGWLGTPGGNC